MSVMKSQIMGDSIHLFPQNENEGNTADSDMTISYVYLYTPWGPFY